MAKAPMGTISKNARSSGSKTQHHMCRCGEEIKMFSVFKNNKLVPEARCANNVGPRI